MFDEINKSWQKMIIIDDDIYTSLSLFLSSPHLTFA